MKKLFVSMGFSFIFGLTLTAAGVPATDSGFWLLIGIFTLALSYALYGE